MVSVTVVEQAIKRTPEKGDKIVVMGGDNYRIGMGGAAVSSGDTGSMGSAIELNAIQRSNPGDAACSQCDSWYGRE